MSVRDRIEAVFERFGYWIVRHRWPAIAVMTALTLGLMSWLPYMQVDNSMEGMLHADDPELLRYNDFRDRFDRDDRVLLVLHNPNLFNFEFLEKLRALHRDIENEVPYVEEVTSLLNARSTRGEADELIVEELLENWPQDEAALAEIRDRALANPLYTNILISDSGRYTTVTIKPYTYSTRGPGIDEMEGFEEAVGVEADEPEFLTEAEGHELVDTLRAVVARYESDDFPVHLVGGPAMNYTMSVAMSRDVSVFMSLSILVIMFLLYVLFRRISGVVLPIAVVLASLLASLGVMVWIGIPMSVTIQILPAFLMVVGVCDSVHILVIVYRQLAAGASKKDAIAYALGHSGLAVVMTSVTTAGGLASFTLAEVAPVAYLGVIAPIGVMLAMVYSLVLMPALLAVTPLKALPHKDRIARQGWLAQFLKASANISTRTPWRVVGVWAAIVLLGAGGVMRARFSHDGMKWFPEHEPLRIAADLIDHEFKGSSTLEILIDSGHENGMHEPEALQRIELAMRHAETLSVDNLPVAKAVSLVDVSKEIHQALNENRPDYYALPQNRQLIAQEFVLFENSGSDDLDDVTDNQFRSARLTVRTPWVDAIVYPDFLEEVRKDFSQILGEALPFEMTGGPVLFSTTFKAVIISMTRSYIFALAVITPMLIALIGSLRRGVLGMIPNLIPVFLVLALMGWADIPIDMSTLLIGGIVIGLAVDDTIHFMHKFNRYYEDTGDSTLAVHRTLETTGAALLFTSLVLSLGFSVFLFAYMVNAFWFGLLASFATVVAFLADVTLGPALMVLATRGHRDERDSTREVETWSAAS